VFDPTPAEMERAYEIVAQEFRRTRSGQAVAEAEIRSCTRDLLRACYALGGRLEDVRSLARVRALDLPPS
jgi:hypothetical protein